MIGLVWGALVEFIESKQTQRQIPRTFIARAVVVITWPLTVFVMVLGIIKNLIHGK